MAAPDQTPFWNHRVAHDAQKNLAREFKRTLRPGDLLLVSDYPLQAEARNLQRYDRYAPEFASYGTFRLLWATRSV